MSFQDEIYYYKIEAYLSGELDADEVISFENQISTDDLLKAQVEKHKVANALIMEQRLLSVKNILQEEQIKDFNLNASFKKPVGFMLLAVAAIGIGTSVWMSNKDDNTTSSSKDSSIKNQIVSQATTPENNTISDNKEGVGKETSQPITAPEENGFHKGQIQQIEENLRLD